MATTRVAYSAIDDNEIEAESPITETLMFRLRDNVLASYGSADGIGPDVADDRRVRAPERLKCDPALASGLLMTTTGGGNLDLLPGEGFLTFDNEDFFIEAQGGGFPLPEDFFILPSSAIGCNIGIWVDNNSSGGSAISGYGTFSLTTLRLVTIGPNFTNSFILNASYQTIATAPSGNNLQAKFENDRFYLRFDSSSLLGYAQAGIGTLY